MRSLFCALVASAACSRAAVPRNLAATATDDFDTVAVTWDPLQGVDGYELQGRIGSGDWISGGSLIPATHDGQVVRGVTVHLDAATPELSSLIFHVRSAKSGSRSAWSNEAAFARGVRPPAGVSASVGMQADGTRTGPVIIKWTNASTVADHVLVERSEFGAVGPWAALQAAPNVTSYVDEDIEDQVNYTYRVTTATSTASSAPVLTSPVQADLVPPLDLRVTKAAGGFALTWTNRSRTATSLQLFRWTGSGFSPDVRSLPVSATTATDALDPAWPNTRYRLTISHGAFPQASTPAVTVPSIALDTTFLSLRGSDLPIPAARWAARDHLGQFHFADICTLDRANGASWDHHPLANCWHTAEPGVAVDAQGRPHAVYVTLTPQTLRHDWYDGSAWQSEQIAPLSQISNMLAYFFGVAADGTVQALWDDGGLQFSVRGAAGWSAQKFVASALVSRFAVAADGTAYAAYGTQLWTHPAGGSWSSEAAPGISTSNIDDIRLAAGDANHVGLSIAISDLPGGYHVWFVQRSGGTWSAPEAVVDLAFTGYSPDLGAAALTADGARAHVVIAVPAAGGGSPPQLIARTPGGWQAIQLGPAPAPNYIWSGYDDAGKVWALVAFEPFIAGLTDSPLYLEP